MSRRSTMVCIAAALISGLSFYCSKNPANVTYSLTISAINGSVTKSPDKAQYDAGTVVTLTATPALNYYLNRWSGEFSDTTNPFNATLTVTMNKSKTITANFSSTTDDPRLQKPRTMLFQNSFETDLSAFKKLKFNPTDPASYGFMTISAAAAHGGTKSITSDSNFSAIMRQDDTLIFSGIIGIEYYIKATELGQTNFNAVMAKNGGSADAMMCWAGFGLDKSDSIRALMYDNPNPPTYRTHGKIELNKWYKFTVEFDWNTSLATYFIDGKEVDTMFALFQDMDELVVWRDKAGATGPKGYYLDDLLYYLRKD